MGDQGSFNLKVALGDNYTEVWSKNMPIPILSASWIEESFKVDDDFPAGSPVTIHIDNHGPNEWNIVDVLVKSPTMEDP